MLFNWANVVCNDCKEKMVPHIWDIINDDGLYSKCILKFAWTCLSHKWERIIILIHFVWQKEATTILQKGYEEIQIAGKDGFAIIAT
jgi:hypothetical protein